MKALRKQLMVTAATAILGTGSALAADEFTALKWVAAQQMSQQDMLNTEGKWLILFPFGGGPPIIWPFFGGLNSFTLRFGLVPSDTVGVCFSSISALNGLC